MAVVQTSGLQEVVLILRAELPIGQPPRAKPQASDWPRVKLRHIKANPIWLHVQRRDGLTDTVWCSVNDHAVNETLGWKYFFLVPNR